MSQEGRKLKKILGSRIILFLLFCGFIWVSINLVNILYKKYKIGQEVQDLKAQINNEEKSNQEISKLIDYFSSQNFLEKTAKEKLNLKKEGEEVIIIEDYGQNASGSPEAIGPAGEEENNTDEEEGKDESNFLKWWKYFFK